MGSTRVCESGLFGFIAMTFNMFRPSEGPGNTSSFFFFLLFIYFATILKNDHQQLCGNMLIFSSLQTQMNLQLCFINNSESEDEEEQEVGKKELKNTQVKNRGSWKRFY